LINTTQQVGGALGLAVVVAVSTAATEHSSARVSAVALTEGFQAGMPASAGIALAGALVALVFVPGRPETAPDAPPVTVSPPSRSEIGG
jgi:hypothetical protein